MRALVLVLLGSGAAKKRLLAEVLCSGKEQCLFVPRRGARVFINMATVRTGVSLIVVRCMWGGL